MISFNLPIIKAVKTFSERFRDKTEQLFDDFIMQIIVNRLHELKS